MRILLSNLPLHRVVMLSKIHHHTGTTSQSLSAPRPLLGKAGTFLEDVGLHGPMSLALRLSISFTETFLNGTSVRYLCYSILPSLSVVVRLASRYDGSPPSPARFSTAPSPFSFKGSFHNQSLSHVIQL